MAASGEDVRVSLAEAAVGKSREIPSGRRQEDSQPTQSPVEQRKVFRK